MRNIDKQRREVSRYLFERISPIIVARDSHLVACRSGTWKLAGRSRAVAIACGVNKSRPTTRRPVACCFCGFAGDSARWAKGRLEPSWFETPAGISCGSCEDDRYGLNDSQHRDKIIRRLLGSEVMWWRSPSTFDQLRVRTSHLDDQDVVQAVEAGLSLLEDRLRMAFVNRSHFVSGSERSNLDFATALLDVYEAYTEAQYQTPMWPTAIRQLVFSLDSWVQELFSRRGLTFDDLITAMDNNQPRWQRAGSRVPAVEPGNSIDLLDFEETELTAKQAAQLLGCSHSYICRKLKDGSISDARQDKRNDRWFCKKSSIVSYGRKRRYKT